MWPCEAVREAMEQMAKSYRCDAMMEDSEAEEKRRLLN